MGVGRWPCFQQFLVNKKEHLLTEALAAITIKMIRTLLPCLLVLSIFVLASGFDTNPEQDVESSQVLKETEEEYVLRKRREALPKKESKPKADKNREKLSKKGKGKGRTGKKGKGKGRTGKKGKGIGRKGKKGKLSEKGKGRGQTGKKGKGKGRTGKKSKGQRSHRQKKQRAKVAQ